MPISIDGKLIGIGNPCFIIAEAGVNHNGDISRAKQMVTAAVEMGADAIKFQTFCAERLVTHSANMATYQKDRSVETSQYDMLKKLELSYEEFHELAHYSKENGIIFLSTPFDFQSVDLLHCIGVGAYKIGSGDLTDISLLQYIAKKNKPVFISSGMSTITEIQEGVDALKNGGCKEIILFHCTSSYPVESNDANLKMIETLNSEFGVPVGFSDHTQSTVIPAAAVAVGAISIEKHFTLDQTLPGPDHKMALNPTQFKTMVSNIRTVEESLGDGIKRITQTEQEIRNVARKSIVAAKDIERNTKITRDMLAMKRPGDGIQPKEIEKIIGMKTVSAIKRNHQIKWEELV